MELTGKRFLLDADLLIESILNRHQKSNDLRSIWQLIQTNKLKAYVTEIGFDRLTSIIRALSPDEESNENISGIFDRYIDIVYLDHHLMQKARGLFFKDYESAIEALVVQKETLDLSGIITHFPNEFRRNYISNIQIITPFEIEEFFEYGKELEASKPKIDTLNFPKSISRYQQFCLPLKNNLGDVPDIYLKDFIGRESGVFNLRRYLQDDIYQVIVLKGESGRGKNHFVLEVAKSCSKNLQSKNYIGPDIFDACIYVKSPKLNGDFNLDYMGYLARTISHSLDDISINFSSPEKQLECIYESLSKKKILIILSNLDTSIVSAREIDVFCKGLPASVKVIITSCEEDFGFYGVNLSSMPKEDATDLAISIADDKDLVLEEYEINNIVESCSYNPLLIKAALLISENYPGCIKWETLTAQDTIKTQRVLNQKLFNSISSSISREILKVLSFANNSFHKEILIEYGKLRRIDSKKIDDSLAQLNRLNLVFEEKGRYSINPIILKLITSVKKCGSRDVNRIYRNLTQTYINFTAQYGGLDWGDWYTDYDLINAEWENIQVVLCWCQQNQHDEQLKTIWNNVNHFADLYGYWRDRLVWLDEISKLSKDKDPATYVQSLSRKAWTLLMTKDEMSAVEASKIITEAWSKRHLAPHSIQVSVAHHLFLSRTYSGRYSDAAKVLKSMQKIIKNLTASESMNPKVLQRWKVNLRRNQAKLQYEKQNMVAAKQLYLEALRMSREIHWNRGICYIYNKLADIAIHETDFDTAAKYLKAGLPMAQQNRNKRRVAGYQKSFSQLEAARGNPSATRRWARLAACLYSGLGMPEEHPTFQKLLENTRM